MKSRYFALNYLGGRVDLLAFREHIAPHYREAVLVSGLQQTVLYVPVADGAVAGTPESAGEDTVSFEIVIYQFDSGYGLVMINFKSRRPIPGLESNPSRYVFGQNQIAGPLLEYLQRALGVDSFATLRMLAHTLEAHRKLKGQTGIDVGLVGLDGVEVAVMGRDIVLLTGTDVADLDLSAAEDISAGQSGRFFALGRKRYWAPMLDEELTWEVVSVVLREFLPARLTATALRWLESIDGQLKQMTISLAERNPVVWAQEREDVEKFDVNYHRFAVSARSQLVQYDSPDLRLIDGDRWTMQSDFGRQRIVLNEALNEAHQAIERMARPLDFREFQTLKTGVEEVENRIMLLTVLLVVIELMSRVFEPGEWSHKGILGGVLALILVGYFLFERFRGVGLLRRGRRLLARNRIERLKVDIRDHEREIQRMQTDDFLSEATRQNFITYHTESVERLRQRRAEYEAEMKK